VTIDCDYRAALPLSEWDHDQKCLEVLLYDIDEEGHFVAFNAKERGVASVRAIIEQGLADVAMDANQKLT